MSSADKVLDRVDDLRDELLDTLTHAIRLRSVNPTYPDQDYDDLVGGESDVARLLAGVYRQGGAETELFGEVTGRDNVVGVLRGAGRAIADLQRPPRRRARQRLRRMDPRSVLGISR
ncbi:hypothetical protein R2361_13260 [Mycobacteroides chelonae]|nr:hypothetical protein [Mycobacteroides chelonae]